MDFLITVIGNAVLDSTFREHLLKDPIHTLDQWGFRLTKNEVTTLVGMLSDDKPESKIHLENTLRALGEHLYKNLEKAPMDLTRLCPQRTCRCSVYPLIQSLREDLRKTAENEHHDQLKTGKSKKHAA